MADWKEIATAPMDGSAIMIWVATDEIVGPHCFAPISITDDGKWWDDSTGDQIEVVKGATHWTALPAPPA